MSTNTYANPDKSNNIPKKLTKKASTYVDLELAKMEAGHLVARPMQGNIEIIQALKDEKNKIAFPDYMAEYLNAYDDGISSVDAGKNIDDKEDVALKHENDQRMKNRDDYVEYYNINDDATARYKKYQEIFLE